MYFLPCSRIRRPLSRLYPVAMQTLPGPVQAGTQAAGNKTSPPIVVSIAGFDPSSGAGFTADLKVFAAHGLYGLACPTALTVQSTQGVRRSEGVQAELVAETLACLADDFPIVGIKIGMLADGPVLLAVARWLAGYRRQVPALPVVLDPVLRSSSGTELLSPEAVALLGSELLPLISVLTPNLDEAAQLSGLPVNTRDAAERAASALLRHMSLPNSAVVVTGGHLGADQAPDDFLLDGATGTWFSGPRVHTRATHGTGCAFSSALLCNLVKGLPLPAAVSAAKTYVRAALQAAYPLGHGRGPMHHLFALDSTRTPTSED